MIAYAVMTHCRLSFEAWSERPIDGNATLTIETSRIVMKNATQTSARARQRRGSGVVLTIREPNAAAGYRKVARTARRRSARTVHTPRPAHRGDRDVVPVPVKRRALWSSHLIRRPAVRQPKLGDSVAGGVGGIKGCHENCDLQLAKVVGLAGREVAARCIGGETERRSRLPPFIPHDPRSRRTIREMGRKSDYCE